MQGRKNNILKSIIFTFIPLFIIFVAAEAGLRLSGMGWEDSGRGWGRRYHHLLGWDLKPNFRDVYFDWVTGKPGEKDPFWQREIAINSLGFRDDMEIDIEKPEGTFRIITLGESSTFGWGVSSKDTYSKLFEKRLNESFSNPLTFQVINAGVPGYTAYQGVLLLKHKLIELSPDLIVVAYGWNHHYVYPLTDKERIKPVSPVALKLVSLARKFRIFQGLEELQRRANNKNKQKLKYRVSFEDTRKNLLDLIKMARLNNIEVILMTMQSNVLTGQVSQWTLDTHSLDNDKDNMILRHKRINDTIKTVAQETGVALVDIAEEFRMLKIEDNEELFYRPEDAVDDVHPNEFGHSIIAEELLKSFQLNIERYNIPVSRKAG